jgi:uncharacterized protein (TIGR02599 family)
MVELLVASAILSLIMVLTLQITSSTNSIWQRTRSRIDTFQESRAAFEAMTRNISQAMLNPYWDYVYGNGASSSPTGYARQSELHFVSGQSATLLKLVNGTDQNQLRTATQCIFFQAPLGLSQSPTTTTATATAAPPLPSLLNVTGYFLEYGDDSKFRPGFLANNPLIPLRKRFRLMEMSQPSESLTVYNWTVQTNVTKLNNWFVDPLNLDAKATGVGGSTRVRRPLAENIIALVILPKRSENDGITTSADGTTSKLPEIAPKYTYDSRLYLTKPGDSLAPTTRNQLPPLVKVAMVAIDETSAARLANGAKDATTPPDFGLAQLFQQSQYGAGLTDDLATLEKALNSDAHRATYRIFSTDVSILQAKWSDN